MPRPEDEFHQAMLATYDQAAELGYRATYFLRLVQEKRGVYAAKQMLAKRVVQSGLMRLQELGRLDISMEALVLQERFRSLFTQEELAEARRRLEMLGYLSAKNRNSG